MSGFLFVVSDQFSIQLAVQSSIRSLPDPLNSFPQRQGCLATLAAHGPARFTFLFDCLTVFHNLIQSSIQFKGKITTSIPIQGYLVTLAAHGPARFIFLFNFLSVFNPLFNSKERRAVPPPYRATSRRCRRTTPHVSYSISYSFFNFFLQSSIQFKGKVTNPPSYRATSHGPARFTFLFGV